MGWTAYPLPNKRWKLWSRGGTRGVCIKGGDSGNEEIEIPSKLLKSLVADDVRSHKISQLEDLDDDAILGLPLSSRTKEKIDG